MRFFRRQIAVLALCLLLIGSAQKAAQPTAQASQPDEQAQLSTENALPITEALAAANERTEVINARLGLADAELVLTRTEADPLALRLETTQAVQGLALGEAQLRQARYQALADVAAAYTRLLEAQLQREFAATARDVRTQLVDIARIRLERGSATALDVQDAENELQDARTNLNSAEQGVTLARTNLESLINQPVDATAPVPDELLAPLPSLETVLLGLETSPTLLQTTQGVELAEVSLDLLDPSYASAAQIDAARLQLEQGQESARDAQRGLTIQARALYNTATSAEQSYRNSLDVLVSAREREALEQQRLNAGLIAEITFKQTQLTTFQAFLAMNQAKNAYLNALFDLQAGTMTALEGLHDF